MRNALDAITLTDLQYLDRLHPPLDAALRRIEDAGGGEDIPVVGTAVGRFLRVAIAALRARRVLEIGTAIGYSALWMGAALPDEGELVTLDIDRVRQQRAMDSWREAGIRAALRLVNGPALEMLQTLRGPFDAVFIDAVKSEYQRYLEAALPLLRPSGLVLVDNLLWSGRVSGSQPDDRTADTAALREFNRAFVSDPRLLATILPLGDGLGYAVKR